MPSNPSSRSCASLQNTGKTCYIKMIKFKIMSLFWSKKVEPDKIIYTRTKSQKRTALLLMIVGLLLLFGAPTLMVNSSFFTELFYQFPWSILFLFSVFFGLVLIFFVAISFLIFYFKFMLAKRGNKKFQITATNEGETIVIEK